MNFDNLEFYLKNLDAFDIREFDLCVKHKGEEVFRYLYGNSDLEGKKPINKENLRWIYSMTKVITVVMIMRLVEREIIELDDPVGKYIPEYKEMFVKTKNGMQKAKNPMLIRHLLSMKSGLSYNINSPSLSEVTKNKKATTQEIIVALAKEPLLFEPGTDYLYSLSHDVLAVVVQNVLKKSWYEILKEEIFTPLGVSDIGFHPTEEQKLRFTYQYQYDVNSFLCKKGSMKNCYCLSDVYESSGAGLFCSTDTYSKIIDPLANGGVAKNGYVLLKPETIKLIMQDQLNEGDAFYLKQGYGYGLGVRVVKDRKTAKSVMSNSEFGWDGAASSYNLIDPENHITIVFSTHIKGCNLFNRAITPRICNLVYEALGLAKSYEE